MRKNSTSSKPPTSRSQHETPILDADRDTWIDFNTLLRGEDLGRAVIAIPQSDGSVEYRTIDRKGRSLWRVTFVTDADQLTPAQQKFARQNASAFEVPEGAL
jgi:hypothetical protein